jgi:polyhydroxybutyrate depolymerase
MARFVLAAWLALALALSAASAKGEEPIVTAHGQYIAVLPTPWDGKSPRPLVLFLHGYGESATDVAMSGDLVPAATKFGAVFVAPDGLGHGWSHVGAPQRRRDDIAFIHEVATDVERRWPIDRKRVYLSGFSIGGSMVWDVACHAPQGFAAFLPISGAFWLPYPRHCAGPINLRHVHGLTDTTVPMEGRTILGKFTQGDVRKGWAILLASGACAAAPARKTQEDDLSCEEWPCAARHALALCLHGDGHDLEPRYLELGLKWAMARGG